MSKTRGQNEGSIYYNEKRERWVGAVTLPGTGKRKVFRGMTRTEVSRKVAKAVLALEQGLSPADDKMTVKQWMALWLASKKNLRYATRRGYESNIHLYIEPELGKFKLAKLTPEHVEGMLTSMEKKGLSPRTAQYAHAVLRGALKQAVRQQKVHRNVASLVDAPTVNHEPVVPLTVDESKALLAAAQKDPMGSLYTVALGLGLRKGEVLGLKWDAVDLEEGRLWVRYALQRQKGTGLVLVEPKSRTSRRPLALPPFVVDALKDQRKQQAELRLLRGPEWQGGEYVFTMTDGRPVSPDYINKCFPLFLAGISLDWCPKCKKATLADEKAPQERCTVCGGAIEVKPFRRVRFHDLRHSAASLLFAQGCSLRLVMEILGHSQIALTANTYTHLLPEADREAATAMQAVLGAKE